MGVSTRAMNVDHSLGAARLRVVLEPLGVSAKRTGLRRYPRRQGGRIFSANSQGARAEDACATGMSTATRCVCEIAAVLMQTCT